ncbi:hypothetical protein CGL51_03635 [Pyrobaculum aerophilum]|uniref:Uncharacterized protein n=1 Tax=Pyrobaculum aerophilum TaxID=13773 RepID=A0A371R0Z3_9CREN|nr:hypothetical protein CGL51_03635 [Pyrobaculum aerophilum]
MGRRVPPLLFGIYLTPYPGLAAASQALLGGRAPGWFLPPPFGGRREPPRAVREVPEGARLRAPPVPSAPRLDCY